MSNTKFSDRCIGVGALFAMLAVCAGAFGAHALRLHISPVMLTTFQTAVDYQFIHSLGLILIGILYHQFSRSCLKKSAGFMFSGIFLFSGSLYVLSLTGVKWLGMITPFGGICFMIAWFLIVMCYLRNGS